MPRSYDCSQMPVMPKMCRTCVFTRTPDGRNWAYPDVARMVENRMMECSQICHAPALKGKPQDHLCRGTRDRQIDIMFKMGVIDAPTDVAWNAKRKELGC